MVLSRLLKLKPRSLGTQLTTLALITGGLAVGLTALGLIAYEVRWFRGQLASGAASTADILGSNTAAALAFGNHSDVNQSLSALTSDKSVARAYVFTADRQLFAQYERKDHSSGPAASGLVTVRPIRIDNEIVGFIRIESDLSPLYDRIVAYSSITLLLAVLSLAIAYPATLRMQAAISGPLLRLEAAAHHVCDHRDYSIRLTSDSSRELDSVMNAFNAMLQEIQNRDRLLSEWAGQLEAQVQARTQSLQEANTSLSAAKERAEEAARTKSEFLANMSHEIRTPMNGILGMTELAFDMAVHADQRNCLEIVRSSGAALLNIINDVLDFSKIEAGKYTLERAEFNPRVVLEEVLRMMAVPAQQKGIELLYDARATLPESVIGDPGRLRQVVVNLLGNAIKFTESGDVTVSVMDLQQHEQSMVAHLAVSDTGIGIAPEWRDHIFDAFVQADGSHTRRYGGSGLGLSISSRLVGLMGGRMWVDTEVGRGSSFHFTLEFGLGTPPAVAPPAEDTLAGLDVLVLDDNAASRRTLCGTLSRWHINPVPADSHEAAVEILRGRSRPFALGLLDASVAGVDRLAMSCPRVFMLEAWDPASSNQRLRENGGCVTKPVIATHLRAALLKAIHGGLTPEMERHTSARLAPGQPLRVLLVEDNVVNQKVAGKLLEKQGHSVAVACDGSDALGALARGVFDIILMDVQMPVMNGYDATRAIRAREQETGGHVPIVALTAHAMKGDREICMNAGMDDYLTKPIRLQELVAVLERQGRAASLPHPTGRSEPSGDTVNFAANSV